MSRILIVDDEPSYAGHLQEILRRDGHQVAVADSAVDAAATFEDYRPEILVSELELTGERSGVWLAQTLRLLDPALAVVLLTGSVDAEVLAAVRRIGGSVACFEKPFNSRELRRVVNHAALVRRGGPPGSEKR
jgi:DNA-binding NtrC family response regulator